MTLNPANKLLLLGACLGGGLCSEIFAQSGMDPYSFLMTDPRHYFCYRIDTPILCDGKLDEAGWDKAAWSEEFQDIEGMKKPYFKTNMKMLWDEEALYVAAVLNEENVWAYLHQHDDIVYHENDFEVFIDVLGKGINYFEIEVNALNTVFDLMLGRPYRDGGKADISWDAKGLISGIGIDGTLNEGMDKDKEWVVEMRIPFPLCW